MLSVRTKTKQTTNSWQPHKTNITLNETSSLWESRISQFISRIYRNPRSVQQQRRYAWRAVDISVPKNMHVMQSADLCAHPCSARVVTFTRGRALDPIESRVCLVSSLKSEKRDFATSEKCALTPDSHVAPRRL
jgi:hypothetical protein